MSIKDEIDVLETIATGKAVAFIGSGASCEMGYPSWEQLATGLTEMLIKGKFDKEYEDICKIIRDKRYAEALGCIEKRTSRQEICEGISKLLKPSSSGSDKLYDEIAKLPFACYLTTNYDDEILKHLVQVGRKDFGVLQNTKEAFFSFRDDMKDIVFKIHGDTSTPENAVITSSDYSQFSSSPERSYFRSRLQALFLMKRSVFVGYSLSDRDLSVIFESLKQICSEIAPSYIFLPNISALEMEEYADRYGIKIIAYKARGADHSGLVKKLNTYSRFISERSAPIKRITDDALHAGELYMFRVLNTGKSNTLDIGNYLLMLIPRSGTKGMSLEELFSKSSIARRELLDEPIMQLKKGGDIIQDGDSYTRTQSGDEKVDAASSSFVSERELAFSDFLKKMTIAPEQIEDCKHILQDCLSSIFETRGDALVKAIFNKEVGMPSGAMIDIYGAILPYASQFDDVSLRTDFLHAVYDFIVTPSSHQKVYLVAMAQGYFLYHMMGHNACQSDLIRERLQKTVWYVDSNLLIPLVAIGCANHDFAVEMFRKMKELKVKLVVAPSVVKEVKQHLKWAEEHNPEDKRNYSISVSLSNGQQNLFVDGYIRSKATGLFRSFSQYLAKINSLLLGNGKDLLDVYNLEYEVPWEKYNWDHTEYKHFKDIFEERRRKTYSFRRDFQIETDAELFYTMTIRKKAVELKNSGEEVCFLSQSTLFDEESHIIQTWSGEAMFRFIQFVMPTMSSEETLHECLQNELYNVGIKFVDENKYERFFAEEIDWAEMTFEQQKKEFSRFLSEPDMFEFEKKFESLPDLQKPIFVRQMQDKELMEKTKQVEELERLVHSSQRKEADVQDILKEKEKEISQLRLQLGKRDAALQSANNRISNLETGKAYAKFRKKQKRKKRRKH